ncbi:hypothetical protein CAL7716_058120 [Calothrix sp. PCC 7716]|nr:hypothetical protein CAL7716_058120 [Calothrix sp. PCC 7716]
MLLTTTNSAKHKGASSHSLNWDNLKDALRPKITYSPIFAAIGGDVQAGVFLSYAYYWTLKTNEPLGWFSKTKEEWFNETQLTRRQLDTIVQRLVGLELISIKYDGVPRRIFYQLNKEAIVDAISRYLESSAEADIRI